jgi:uncharacterized 2Fe-2S/4Fe-4S cluster protein (DUF4445 family)
VCNTSKLKLVKGDIMYKVRFLPDGNEVEVEDGTTIMEAAEKAGVFINSLCGGKGVCGKCRVQVSDGKVKADKHSIGFLSKDEVKDGYVLACQSKVDDNLEIVIPPESRLEAEQIVMEQPVVDYSQPEKVAVARVPSDPMTLFEPLVQKIFQEPTTSLLRQLYAVSRAWPLICAITTGKLRPRLPSMVISGGYYR